MTHHWTEAERKRAREAAERSACDCGNPKCCPDSARAVARFDRLYPPVDAPEPPLRTVTETRTAPNGDLEIEMYATHSPVSSAAFEAALDKTIGLAERVARVESIEAMCNGMARVREARAEVVRLHAEALAGEEMTVERLFLRYGEGHGICFAEDDDRYAPGDKVRVVKVENTCSP